MARIYSLILTTLFVLVIMNPSVGEAQSPRYELLPSPDLWYNDVDGIRVGLRLKGQVPGTFEDGPHRLDAGLWLGLWFPKLPVSYYLSYTEPIQPWSEYGSEASVQVISSIRTGYHDHGIGFNKRWQQGFDERRYREFRLYTSYEKRFDEEYTLYPVLWSDQDKLLSSLTFSLQNDHALGWYTIQGATTLQYLNDFFSVATLRATQRIDFHEYWGIRMRAFTGLSSGKTAPEYLFSRSMRPAVQWMGNGFTRAKGTIPRRWMESDNIQIAGGAGLRGYTSQDAASFRLNTSEQDVIYEAEGSITEQPVTEPILYQSFASVNIEFDYWNPIAVAFNQIPYASEFLSFRSYLFFDSGTPLSGGSRGDDRLFSNAGAGFSLSLNIPDYQGKPRGFVLRYEIPFWLSNPGHENSFKLRHLAGFGAVISF